MSIGAESVVVTTGQPAIAAAVIEVGNQQSVSGVPEVVVAIDVVVADKQAAVDVTVNQTSPLVVVIGEMGPPGPRGPAGGGTGGSVIVFDQAAPSASWNIAHGLGRYPIVAVYDLAGIERPLVPIANPDLNTTILSPNPPLAGKAVLT